MEENNERIFTTDIKNIKKIDMIYKNDINYNDNINDNSFRFVQIEKTKYFKDKKSQTF